MRRILFIELLHNLSFEIRENHEILTVLLNLQFF